MNAIIIAAPRLWTPDLQPAQTAMLPYLAAGWGDKQISEQQGWGERTARGQMHKILQTLALSNRSHVALWAMATGRGDADHAVRLLLQQAPHLALDWWQP